MSIHTEANISSSKQRLPCTELNYAFFCNFDPRFMDVVHSRGVEHIVSVLASEMVTVQLLKMLRPQRQIRGKITQRWLESSAL